MLAACLIAGATTTGCGDGDGADLATLTPPDVPLYLELVVRPDGDQAEAITSFSERLAGISDPGERLAAAVDDQLAENDVELSYAEDVEPWLGEHAALFVRSFEAGPAAAATPDFALILEAADADAAGSFVDRVAELDPATARMRSHAGVDYYALGAPDGAAIGLVENAVVVGTEMSLRVAIDAADGQSLAESDEHAARAAALGEDLLATASLDPAAVLEAATTSGDVARADLRPVEPLLDGPLSEPIAIGLSATPETATADFVAMVLDPEQPLGESERFRSTVEALGEGFSPGFYLDLPGALAAARASGAAAAFDDPAAAALAAIELVSAGSRLDDHLGVTRVTATLAEQED